jgi:hypothetical protein
VITISESYARSRVSDAATRPRLDVDVFHAGIR